MYTTDPKEPWNYFQKASEIKTFARITSPWSLWFSLRDGNSLVQDFCRAN